MDWGKIWSEILSMEPGIGEICLRLGCAMLVGLVIGTEREFTHRPAGMRTHILVALGACVVAITSELLFRQYRALGATPDPARLSAQVITGVGFLGAGTIMREGATVKGLTTAASLWAVACLGIAAGAGYYALAFAGMGFIFVTLTVLEFFQHRIMTRHSARHTVELETPDVAKAMKLIHRYADEGHAQILHLEVENMETGFRIRFQTETYGRRSKEHYRQFIDKLAAEQSVVHFQQTTLV